MKIKIDPGPNNVTVKWVDLTFWEPKTLQYGFPVDPPQWLYHLAAFSEHGVWWVHKKRIDSASSEEAQRMLAMKGEFESDDWLRLIEFNTYLRTREEYEQFAGEIV